MMAAQWDARDKNILITGAASGLGAAYAEALLKEGAKNIAVLDIDEKTGQNFVAKLNETYNNKAIFVKCDVSKEDEITSSFDTVRKKINRIDVLINNAGIMSDTNSVWRLACDVNWQGLVSFTMKAVKHMRKDEGGAGGTIVNISSTAGICKLDFLPIYCGSKGAVLHFSQSLASGQFYKNTGIRVLTLCPGPTATKLMDGLDQRIVETTNMKQLESVGGFPIQRVESAVAAMMKLLRDGDNGSIWLSANDKPALELTPQINKYLNELEKRLVNISSTAGICKFEVVPIYCGSKGAVLHFSQSLASGSFYKNTGIRVLTLCPGPTATKLMEGLDRKIVEATNVKQLEELDGVLVQRVESAVAAMMKLLRDGNNGSIWLSVNDKPALARIDATDQQILE